MTEFHVDNMSCGHCVAAVTTALRTLDPAARVETDLAAARVRVASTADPDRLAAALAAAGYPVRAA